MGRCSPLILQPPFWGDCVGGTDPLISSRLGSEAVEGRPAYPVASHRPIYIGRPTRGDGAGGAERREVFDAASSHVVRLDTEMYVMTPALDPVITR